MDEQDIKSKKLLEDPALPSMYVVYGSVVTFIGLMWKIIPNGLYDILQILLIFVVILLTFTLYFTYKCYKNKTKLHGVCEEVIKSHKNQNTLIEKLKIKNNELQKTLKSQIAINEKQEDELTTIRSTKVEELNGFMLQYIASQAVATLTLNQQRKDD